MPHQLSTMRKESDCFTSAPRDIDIIYSRAALMSLGDCASSEKSLGEIELLEGPSPFATGFGYGEDVLVLPGHLMPQSTLDANDQLDSRDNHNAVVTSRMGTDEVASARAALKDPQCLGSAASMQNHLGETIGLSDDAALIHRQMLPARWRAPNAEPTPEKPLDCKRKISSVIDDDRQRARAEAIRAKLRLVHMLPGSPADTKLSPISKILLRRSKASR
eukprot:6211089-Pleurochrysis_carterae.AAC.3